MSPTLNRSSVLQRFECDNAVKKCNGTNAILSGTATYTHTYTYKVHNSTMRMWNVFPNVSVSSVTGPRPAVFVEQPRGEWCTQTGQAIIDLAPGPCKCR